jgi:hypothetical protein
VEQRVYLSNSRDFKASLEYYYTFTSKQRYMPKKLNSNILTIINFGITAYFLAIYLINLYQIDFVIVGVFRELLTIPLMLAELVFLFLSLRFIIYEKKYSFLFLLSVIRHKKIEYTEEEKPRWNKY